MKIPRIYLILIPVAIVLSLLLAFLRADILITILIVMGSLTLLIILAIWVIKKFRPPPVPDYAVRQLLDKCREYGDREWVLVEFTPGISLEQAAVNIGRPITREERLEAFMTKLAFVSQSMPDAVVFYSHDKGFACGNRYIILEMVNKYGNYMLDNWYSLGGALRRNGFQVHSLDGGQFISSESLFGN